MQEVANVEVELSRAEGTIRGFRNHSAIEDRAHSLGMQLTRQMQGAQQVGSGGGSGGGLVGWSGSRPGRPPAWLPRPPTRWAA